MKNNKPLIKLNAIQERLKNLKKAPAAEKPPHNIQEPLLSPLIEAAAVLGMFEVERIRPIAAGTAKPDRDTDMLGELLLCCDPVLKQSPNRVSSANMLYCLRKPVRRQALQHLLAEGRLQDALLANSKLTAEGDDPLQQMLTLALTDKLPVLTTLHPEQLRGLREVYDWLEGIGAFKLPDPTEIDRRLEMEEMLVPFKHLTGTYRDGRFEEFFRGRHHELAQLRDFVGVTPPSRSIYDKVWSWITGFVDTVIRRKKKPPLLLTGMGGSGKSTLLAKFILSQAELHEQERFPFVYVDFDRPNISPLKPETLLVEAARQLAIQYPDVPDFCKAARNYYDVWSKVNMLLEDTSYSVAVTVRSSRTTTESHHDRESMQNDFIRLFSHFPRSQRKPFLIVLDTFEEVQYKGEAYVSQLYYFMSQLQQQYPLLRTVVSGRAPVTQFKAVQLELKSLDQEAARSFLENVCKIDTPVASVIASKIGGNPLTLKLAAEFMNAQGVTAFGDNLSLQSYYVSFERQLSEIERQGILYKRILDHVHKPKVRRLVNPGLTLRYITPRLIKEVLNVPCELEIGTDAAAAGLFEEAAREVSLVTRIKPDTLQHRPDIRMVMLRLMNQGEPEKVADIHERAVKYYAKQNDLAAKAEEFYHRLCLDEPASQLDCHWKDGMQQFLADSIAELPPRAQAYLVARTGVGYLEDSIWAQAEDQVKERWAIRRVGDLLNSGRPTEALSVIRATLQGLYNDRGTLRLMLVRVLVELGKKAEAVEAIRSILGENQGTEIATYRKELLSLLRFLTRKKDKREMRGDTPKKAMQDAVKRRIKGSLPVFRKDNKEDDDDLPPDQQFDMTFKL